MPDHRDDDLPALHESDPLVAGEEGGEGSSLGPDVPNFEVDGPVRRERDLDAGVEAAWELLRDGEGLSTWLADDVDLVVAPGEIGTVRDEGGEDRPVFVEEVEEGRRVALRWVTPDGEVALVDLVLDETESGSRLTVTEIPLRLVSIPDAVPATWSLGGGSGASAGPQMALACR